jgi:hypothetical protein
MMMRVSTHLKAVCLAFAVLFAMPAVANAVCVSQQEARRFVNSGQAIPLSQALRQAGVSGKVVRVALCKTRGQPPFYRLAVLGPGGRLNKIVIPAN